MEVRGRKLEVYWKFRVGIVLVKGGKFRSWEFESVKFRVGISVLEVQALDFFRVGNSW